MTDLDALGTFYLGAVVDDRFERTPEPLVYDASDLTTHAVIVGMTGSGKTGLGVALIEEAALDGVPVLVVDPKGDMGNLALRFPGLKPEDLEPWIDPREAERTGTDLSVYAASVADDWRVGLASWGQGTERIERLRRSDVAIYTPGSSAGIPLSVLKSFAPPHDVVMSDPEALADRLDGTVASLLTLVGREPNPLGREHLLLAAILDAAWRQGEELDLADLVRTVQEPPVAHLGVMDLETMFPTRDRMKLAVALNALLASPSFTIWTQGEPLDLQGLLYDHDGKPRVAVMTISHLSDAERLFFLTLLFSEVVAWTRSLTGTTSLRALVYVDELFGMLPPVAEPPTKRPLLTLLKQARASGVGLALSTQNPVDLDYKALSNAGTWLIGRLQTERDKQRLLEGLRTARGSVDASDLDTTISSLPKRTFVMRSVHAPEPVVFQTRWVMSYLAGPMSREQIGRLADSGLVAVDRTRREAQASMSSAVTSRPEPVGTEPEKPDASVRPVLPPHLPELYLPNDGAETRVRYFPSLLGVADVYYHSKTHGVAEQRRVALLLEPVEGPSPVEWSRAVPVDLDLDSLPREAETDATFAPFPALSLSTKDVDDWRKSFERWFRTEGAMRLFRDPTTKATSRPSEPEMEFRLRCAQKTREMRDEAIAKVRARYGARLETVQRQLLREEQAVAREQQQFQARAASVAGSVIGALFGGRRSLSTAVNRASMGAKDLGDVNRAKERLEDAGRQYAELESQLRDEVDALEVGTVHPEEIALETVVVRPLARDVVVRFFGVAWVPYVSVDGHWTSATLPTT